MIIPGIKAHLSPAAPYAICTTERNKEKITSAYVPDDH